eukprot:scaffold9.g3254.t1
MQGAPPDEAGAAASPPPERPAAGRPLEEPTPEDPAAQGFRMPAEWERHARTWMGWPERPDNWRDSGRPAQRAYAEVAMAISQFEPVTVCANPGQLETARHALPGDVAVACIPQDDAWFRDTGPTFIARGAPGSASREVAGVDWQFNAWGGAAGGLYPCWERDQLMVGAKRFPAGLVMEGGSIHVDGEGTLLTTEECLLNPNRNPALRREEIEGWLARMLGVQARMAGRTWHAMVPMQLAALLTSTPCRGAGVVLLAWTDDQADPQYERSAKALEILSTATDARGRPLQVVKLQLPPSLYTTAEEAAGVQESHGVQPRLAGERLAATYVNFYICNGGVVMPAFGGEAAEADARAKAVLEEVFPDHRVVQLADTSQSLGNGAALLLELPRRVSGIYPVLFMVGVSCSAAIYQSVRNVLRNPDCRVNSKLREDELAQADTLLWRAKAYYPSVFRFIGETRTKDKGGPEGSDCRIFRVYPLFGVVGLALSALAYSSTLHLFKNPDVRLNRVVRANPMADDDVTQKRVEEYKKSLFRAAGVRPLPPKRCLLSPPPALSPPRAARRCAAGPRCRLAAQLCVLELALWRLPHATFRLPSSFWPYCSQEIREKEGDIRSTRIF